MSTNVQRRRSRGPLGWFRGKAKSPHRASNPIKAGPRTMQVLGPRKMRAPVSMSVDALVEPNETPVEPSPNQPLTSVPSSPVVATPQMWAEERSSDISQAFDMDHVTYPASPRTREWDAVPVMPQPLYQIHEPNGPAYYINFHLRPPPNTAPRTSFPPTVRSSSGQTSSQTSSSQKFESQQNLLRGYMDDVDSLDLSDPHGTRWHHTSPYDLGRRHPPRLKSTVVGPGVGTYAGAVEGSEILDSVRSYYGITRQILIDFSLRILHTPPPQSPYHRILAFIPGLETRRTRA